MAQSLCHDTYSGTERSFLSRRESCDGVVGIQRMLTISSDTHSNGKADMSVVDIKRRLR